jgi:type III pantothenate kinase
MVAAVRLHPGGGPGLVVSCGTAITVDRIAVDGTWQGGAIAPGLRLSARALHLLTAQLPEVDISEAPPVWGPSTLPALAAGVYWGVVGSIRELLKRQETDLLPSPWLLWTGGDAPNLAPWIAGDDAHIVPDLVLLGLSRVAHGRVDR